MKRLIPSLALFLFLASLASAQPTISTYAGGLSGTLDPLDMPVPSALGVAIDSSGSLYVSLRDFSVVVRVNVQSGQAAIVAGIYGVSGYSGDGGPATAASLSSPWGVAVDANGNLYIADCNNNRVRKVDTNGIITTVAGNGIGGYAGDGGQATSARLYYPRGVAVDTSGNLFIADTSNQRIRLVNTSGIITTVAGNGTYGFSGDGTPATSVSLASPLAVAVDINGNLYIADSGNNRIRRVSTGGTLTTIAGTGSPGYSGDGGAATSARLNNPISVALDSRPTPTLFIADNGNNRIRMVNTSSTISTVAGNGSQGYSGDGPATSASLNSPNGVALGPGGNLYIADTGNNRIRMESGGNITTVAGNGYAYYSGDGDPATSASLRLPYGVAVDATGNLYIVDYQNERIRKVDTSGITTTVAGNGTAGYSGDGGPAVSASLYDPVGVAADASGNLYIADHKNHRIRKVDTSGTITTVAGNGFLGFTGDGGPATSARLYEPWGVAVDATGNLYIGDLSNRRVRKVDATTQVITTVAGNGTCDSSGDGGPASSATVCPAGVAVASGNLYIADFARHRVRKVDPSGIITTVAGNGIAGFSGDGGIATNARLNNAFGVKVDINGTLYIADYGNNRIRKVDASGVITTVAGSGTYGYSGDGGPATSARLAQPTDVVLGASGDLYIADANNNRIRLVNLGRPPSLTVQNSTVQVDEGSTAQNTGTFSDPEDDPVTLSASVGSVSETGPGAWSWSFGTTDGPTQSQTVTITATDSNGNAGQITFALTVINVAPSGELEAPDTAVVGQAFLVGFTTMSDPSTDDMAAPVTYAFECGQGKGFSEFSTEHIFSCQADAPGSFVISAKVRDKDLTPIFSTSRTVTVGAADATPPVIEAVFSPGLPNAAGWHNQNVSLSWNVSDPESGIASSTGCGNFVISQNTAGQDFTCSATNGRGLSNSVTRTVKIDKTKPVIAASATSNGAPYSAGWTNKDVVVSFSCSDTGGSGIATDTVAGATVGAEGQNQSLANSGTCADVAGNAADTVSFSAIDIDKTPPEVKFGSANPLPNGASWNNSDVDVPFTVSDPLSGVASMDPASSPLALTSEGASVTATVTVTDKAGNSVTATTPAFKIDKTKPALTFQAATPVPNAAGWNNSDVSVPFTTSDTGSGVDTSSPASPLSLTAEGSTVSGAVTVTDLAGNTETFTSASFKIDKTAPTATTAALPAPNGAAWNKTDVAVTFSGTDALSGIASCTDPANLTTEGSGLSASGTCSDQAGNTSAQATATVNIDKTPPDVTFGTATPPPNGAGWHNTNVTVPFNISESLSGLASTSTSSPLVLSTEGDAVTAAVTATDKAGNSATATTAAFKIDKTRPTVTFGALNPAPNPAGWNNTNVSAPFTVADNLAGVASTNPPASPLLLSAEGAAVNATVTVTDAAGNSATFSSPQAKIDKTSPAVTATAVPPANAYGWNNTNVAVNFNGTDALSGIATCTAPGTLTAEGIGQSASGSCTDNAGNTSAAAAVTGIKIDKTPPRVTFGAPTPLPNAAGWNKTNVSIAFTASDASSGLASATPASSPLVLATEGAAVKGTVTVTDKAGNTVGVDSPAVRIDKTAPALSAFGTTNGAPYAFGAWTRFNVAVSFPCQDPLSGPASWPAAVSVSREGTTSLPGSCKDNAGNSTQGVFGPVKIDKTPPVVSNLVATPNPVAVNKATGVAAKIGGTATDAAPIAVAECQVEEDPPYAMTAKDGSLNSPTENIKVTMPPYPHPELLPMCVRGTDAAGNVSAPACMLLPVYDPNGGYVVGSGSLRSPAGAYVAKPKLAGTATFAFGSKYLNRATVPNGQTDFSLQVGGFKFKSTAYEWLIVSSAKAQYKGSGTVNGSGQYGFMLTAIAGRTDGGGGPQRLRIKIWKKSDNKVVYDNQMGAADTVDPATVIDNGGHILIGGSQGPLEPETGASEGGALTSRSWFPRSLLSGESRYPILTRDE